MKSLLFNLISAFRTASCIVLKLPVSKLQTGLHKANVLFLLSEHLLLHLNKVCIHPAVVLLSKKQNQKDLQTTPLHENDVG